MLQLLITYIWFGSTIPTEYLLKLQTLSYPTQLLINPPNNMTYKLNIQKSDRYRLEILRDGGVYADFDTFILYDCLMGMLEGFRGEMLVGDYAGQEWKHKIANNFIYVPKDNTSLIREILEKQGHSCTDDVVTCHGPEVLQKYRDRISVVNIDACVGHNFDFSWSKDSYQKYWNLAYKIIGVLAVLASVVLGVIYMKRKEERRISEERRREREMEYQVINHQKFGSGQITPEIEKQMKQYK